MSSFPTSASKSRRNSSELEFQSAVAHELISNIENRCFGPASSGTFQSAVAHELISNPPAAPAAAEPAGFQSAVAHELISNDSVAAAIAEVATGFKALSRMSSFPTLAGIALSQLVNSVSKRCRA